VSPHIGDLRSPRTRALSLRTAGWLAGLLGEGHLRSVVELHPEEERDRAGGSSVQHHHAHVLACMAENGVDEAILGVAWDGNGYGPDGTVWGGEFLVCDRHGYRRFAHLHTFPLPGAERAILEPRRAALGILFELYGACVLHDLELAPVRTFTAAERRTIARMLERRLNSPRTSSMGRLFDAVASLLDLRHRVTFEGQAAMALEFAARGENRTRPYALPLREGSGGMAVADWSPLVEAVLRDLRAGRPRCEIAASFHDALAELIVAVARRAGFGRVALAGGCFQNQLLLGRATDRLRDSGFEPLYHRRVPPNDGAIALGQVVHAASGAAGEA
jgi:hydrogenase maturation protein HypF